MGEPVTVSNLTLQIRMLLEGEPSLRDVWVTGEVSNWKRAASGHVYFRLKDSGATINAVMWKGSVISHSWLPRDGDQVVAHGYVGVYPEGGNYQFYANQLRPAGRGQLYAQFEALKAQLQAEGLFDAERKRPIPAAPQRIAIVTSADAAALRDVLRVLSARWPTVEVVVFPTLVQGSDAPMQIVAAIAAANRYHVTVAPVDTLLVTRGGGSIEDLWAFNDERVVRAIAASTLPVVSGVGHETDFTIADFVADLRAPTPSAAAAQITPDRAERIAQFDAIRRGLAQQALARLDQEQTALVQLQQRLQRVHPGRQLDLQKQRLDERSRRLNAAIMRRLERATDRHSALVQQLESLSPQRVLERGYSIVQREDGVVVRGPLDATAGAELKVRAAAGSYRVQKLGDAPPAS